MEVQDYRYQIAPYLPVHLQNDEEFMELFGIVEIVANDIKSYIDSFNDLIDVDAVSDLFLPKLTYLIDYEYRYQMDTVYQRELIKRLIHIYKNKGTDDDLINVINNGTIDEWVGHDLFYPGDRDENLRPIIIYPIEHVFTHNVSTFSGGDVFPDGVLWTHGVVLITVEVWDDKLDEYILRVLPAGVKYVVRVRSDIIPEDGDVISFGEGRWIINNDWCISWLSTATMVPVSHLESNDKGKALVHSVGGDIHSGRKVGLGVYVVLGLQSYTKYGYKPSDSWIQRFVLVGYEASYGEPKIQSPEVIITKDGKGNMTRDADSYRESSYDISHVIDHNPGDVGINTMDGTDIKTHGDEEYIFVADDNPDLIIDGSTRKVDTDKYYDANKED